MKNSIDKKLTQLKNHEIKLFCWLKDSLEDDLYINNYVDVLLLQDIF